MSERERESEKQYDPSKVWELSALTTLRPQSHVMAPTCHASTSNTNDIMCARAYFSKPSIIDRFRKLNAMDAAQRGGGSERENPCPLSVIVYPHLSASPLTTIPCISSLFVRRLFSPPLICSKRALSLRPYF